MRNCGKGLLKCIAYDTVLILICWILILFIFLPYMGPGFAYGADMQAHFYIAQFIADFFSQYHTLPDWDPNWYAGFSILHNIPPLVYVILAFLQLVCNDIRVVSKIYTCGWAFLYCLMVYLIVKKRYGRVAGATAALLATLAPSTIDFLGSATRSASIFFLPLSVLLTDKILEEGRLSNTILLSFILCLSMLSHIMFAGFIIISLFLYAILRIYMEHSLSTFRFFTLFASSFFAALLTCFWFIPFYFEGGVRRVLTAQYIISKSVPTFSALVEQFGLALIILGVCALILRRTSTTITLFIVGAFGLIFSLKDYSPIYYLPFLNIFYPKAGLAVATFFFAYLSSTLVSHDSPLFEILRKRIPYDRGVRLTRFIVAMILIGLCLFNFRDTYRSNIKTWDIPDVVQEASMTIGGYPNEGRVAFFFSGGKPKFIHYALTTIARKPSIEGHYFSNTPFAASLAHIYDSINEGWPLYAVRKYIRLNVRYFLTYVRDDSEQKMKIVDALESEGFSHIKNEGNIAIYYNDTSSTYIRKLDSRILVVGKYSSIFARLFPESVEGSSPYLDDYEKEYLDQFDLLVLYGFGTHDEGRGEALIRDFLSHGSVIVDLFGQLTNPLQSPGLFGVLPHETSLSGLVNLEKGEELPMALSQWDLTGLDQPWMAQGYQNLDSDMVTLEEKRLAIMGIKNIEGKPVYFFGGNWFYYVYKKKDKESLGVLKTIVDASLEKSEENRLDLRDVSFAPQHNIVTFSYSTLSETPTLVSMIYSPHWKAYVDGAPRKTYSCDNLILLTLPKGSHNVHLEYESLPIHTFATLLSVATLVFMIYLVLRRKGYV